MIGMILQIGEINNLYGTSGYLSEEKKRNHKVLQDVVNICNEHEAFQLYDLDKEKKKITFTSRLEMITSLMQVLNREII